MWIDVSTMNTATQVAPPDDDEEEDDGTGVRLYQSIYETALRNKVPDIRIVRIPLQAHSLQIIAPATCAETLLHFAARHDGIACHEQ